MKRFKNYDLRIMILFIVMLLFLNPNSIFLNLAHAADSTPSSDIKAKLEQLKAEIASKAAKLKAEVDKNLTNKAYIGKVKQKSDTTLTLATDTGPKIVNINQDTEFESQVKGKKATFKAISEEDYLASLGDVDETGVLTAKKIVLLPTPDQEPKTYFWGQIVAISDTLVTLKNKDSKNIAVSMKQSVKMNDFVILTGKMGKNDIFEAEFVYIIPQGGILKPKKIATPSASPKAASSSAKKKAN